MPKWQGLLILFTRYMDDIKALGDLSEDDARELMADLEAREPSINFTFHRSKYDNAKFLDLQIMMVRKDEDTSIEYRLFRNPGNTMAYVLADSYHPAHTTTGIVKAEFRRLLLKSSQRLLAQVFTYPSCSASSCTVIAGKLPDDGTAARRAKVSAEGAPSAKARSLPVTGKARSLSIHDISSNISSAPLTRMSR